jgi:hypothetical protein
MMTTPSVENSSPPTQDEPRCLGERDDRPHRLRVYETDSPGVAQLRRYRFAAYPPYDAVAEVHHAGGVVSEVAWDERHRVKDLSTWRANVEAWIKARIAEDWSEQ